MFERPTRPCGAREGNGSIETRDDTTNSMSNPIRPRLRPTLSRKTKYVGIAPSAQKKLGREARRGSHDLRKLVGHANFLDVLIEQLDIDQEEGEEDVAAPTEVIETGKGSIEEEEETQLDDEEDSDDWTSEEDESDDEG